MIDTSDLGVVAAELMEKLERSYLDKEDVKIGVVAVIAEVEFSDADGEYTVIEYRCSDGRKWVQAGLFAQTSRAVHYEETE